MNFRIADTFTASLAKLTGDEQKAVKTTAFDLQMDPASPGMHPLRFLVLVFRGFAFSARFSVFSVAPCDAKLCEIAPDRYHRAISGFVSFVLCDRGFAG